MKQKTRFDTLAVRLQAKRSDHHEHSVPVFETSSFVFKSAEEARAVFAEDIPGNIYSRFSNPNTDEFIQKLCALEGAEDGVATASGMAAVYLGLTALLRPGDHILSSRQIFGTTHLLFTQVFPKWGISHSYAGISRKEEWENGILPNTRLIYAESPSNPGLEIIDLRWLAKLAKKHRVYLVIDNCFATPYLQNPLHFGADLVIHSATKFIDGQGRTISGAVLGSQEIMKEIRMLSKITGPVMSPHTAWLLSKSLETLAVRMDRHCSNALALASFLEQEKDVRQVRYPFLRSHPQYRLARRQMKQGGGLVTFELMGGEKRAHRFIDALQLISITSNLGDSRTTITHPATTTHAKLTSRERKESGVTDGMIRISVGLEHIDDIIADFQQAIVQSSL
jgi:O-succinylhomoserine sulfhydrylase